MGKNLKQLTDEKMADSFIKEATGPEIVEPPVKTRPTISDMTSRVKSPTQGKDEILTRQEALDGGYILYWNGKGCPNGHYSVRYARDGSCKECYQDRLTLKDQGKRIHFEKLPEPTKVEEKVQKIA